MADDDDLVDRERFNERRERREREDRRDRTDAVSSLPVLLELVGLEGIGGVVTPSDDTTVELLVSSSSTVVERGEGTLEWKDLGRTRFKPLGESGGTRLGSAERGRGP